MAFNGNGIREANAGPQLTSGRKLIELKKEYHTAFDGGIEPISKSVLSVYCHSHKRNVSEIFLFSERFPTRQRDMLRFFMRFRF